MSNKQVKIGITGGIGSGKSIVCRIFEVIGAPVYYADDRAKQLITESSVIRTQITDFFGESSFVHGEYNRPYIASLVFSNPEKLALLNSILHPAVAKDFKDWILKNTYAPYIVKEAALIFDGPNSTGLDRVYVVTAPEKVRIERVRSRDQQRSIHQIEAIISHQMLEEEMIKLSTGLIDNSGVHMLIPQILSIHQSLVKFH